MSVSRTVSGTFSVKEWRDFETGGRGRSRSLKLRRSTDHIRLFVGPPLYISGTVFELLDVEKYRDLEICVRGH